jgi:membrane protease YdiL (CAAX protease family)
MRSLILLLAALDTAPTSAPLIEQVDQAQNHEYETALASFDDFIGTHPTDVAARVERCRFIGHFAAAEDSAIESAYEQSDACIEALEHSKSADSAAVQLYLFEQKWGDAALKTGEALVKQSQKWTPEQRSQLHERLASLYSSSDVIKAGAHALSAIRLNPQSDVRLIAAEYLIRIGAKTAAIRTIDAMPRDKWTPWELASAVKLLVGMGAAQDANRLVESNSKVKLPPGTRVILARALFASGATDAARRMLTAAAKDADQAEATALTTLREMFELERDYGSTETATAAYRRLRDKGYSADPFGRHRVSLSLHRPAAPWKFKDTAGIGALLLALVACAMLPLVVVAPLHYRSVVKQLRGKFPEPASTSMPWSLKHLWYALGVLCVAGMATLYAMDYPAFHAVLAVPLGIADQYELLASEQQLGNAMLVSTGLSIIALLPLLKGVNLRALFLGEWSVKRALLTGFGASFALYIANGIFRAATHTAALGTDTTRSLQGISTSYGPIVMLLFVAGVIPVMEEFVFRGVMLRTTARYYALWIAVILQAALFVVWHEDTSGYPFIFALALAAAWLARKSGGLLAPITLHATNNLIAGLSVLGATRALEYLK